MKHLFITSGFLMAALAATVVGCGSDAGGTDSGNGGADGKGASGNGTGSTGNGSDSGNGGAGNGSGSGTGSTSGSGGYPEGTILGPDGKPLPTDIKWSYDPSKDEELMTCASETVGTVEIPIDVFIMLDKSGSMNLPEDSQTSGSGDCNVGGSRDPATRWCNAVNAIGGFVNDPVSVGMGIGYGSFEGSSGACTDPLTMSVPLDVIQSNDANMQKQEMIAALNADQAGGGTSTRQALNTLISYTSARKAALAMGTEQRKVIGILVTDGEPTSCLLAKSPSSESNASRLARSITALNQQVVDHFDGGDGIPTFFVGMTGLDEDQLEQMAVGGGATPHNTNCEGSHTSCSYYSVGDGDAAVFQAVLNSIRESVSGCDFQIPDTGKTLNLDKVDVKFNPGSALSKVADLAACSGSNASQYYVEANGNTPIIHLCPNTCENKPANAEVDVEIKCEGS